MFVAQLIVAAVAAAVAASGAAATATPSWPSLSADIKTAGGGEQDVAVVVGISKYFALPDIPGPAENANDWYQYLVRARGIPVERVTLLLNG